MRISYTEKQSRENARKLAKAEAWKQQLEHELRMHVEFPEVHIDNAKAIRSIKRRIKTVEKRIEKLLSERYGF